MKPKITGLSSLRCSGWHFPTLPLRSWETWNQNPEPGEPARGRKDRLRGRHSWPRGLARILNSCGSVGATGLRKRSPEFTKAILEEGQPVEAIERPGERPLIVRAGGRDSLAKAIANDIRRLQEEGFGSIAVICRTARESWVAS